MLGEEILRIVDSIHRDKNIDKEIVFKGIESALLSAARKHYGIEKEISINIERESGNITAYEGTRTIEPEELGRIAAQMAKQIIIQKIREAERDVIFEEYEGRIGTLVNGTIRRFEGPNWIINLGRVEGVIPRSGQIPSESYRVGERIRAIVTEVKKSGSRVRIALSRTSADFVRALFELEVPEIGEKVVTIKVVAREPGHRTKIAVDSNDPKVDAVGACVGVKGSRIKIIVDEMNGEKIDIVRWSDEPETFIVSALKPAEISAIRLDDEKRKAQVIVNEEQLSLAIGRHGQNVRLAGELAGWDIDIMTAEEAQEAVEAEEPSAAGASEEGERQEQVEKEGAPGDEAEEEKKERATGEDEGTRPAAEEAEENKTDTEQGSA